MRHTLWKRPLRSEDDLPYDDCADDVTTTCSLEIRDKDRGEINVHPSFVTPKLFGRKGDVDWYAMDLDA